VAAGVQLVDESFHPEQGHEFPDEITLPPLIPVTLLASPQLAAIVAAAVLTGIVIAHAARARRNPAELPSPPARGPS
jgi:hypothetical protein